MKKNNIAVVLLAVMMICLVPFKIYAAGVPSLDEVRSAWLKGDSGIKLSDYYFIYNYTAKDRSGEFYDFTTITVVDDSFKGQLFAYRDDNSTPVGGNIYFMSFCDDKIITGAEAGVYVRNATYYNINGSQLNSASGLGGGYDMKYLGSDIMKNFNISDTNIPLFDSKESAENYFNTGDTSGLLNGDKVSSYDPSLEVPQDFKITFSGNKLFRDDGSVNQSDFQFEWSQSDDIDLQDYRTEIYVQATIAQMNIIDVFKKDYSKTYLTDKLLLVDCTTDYSNSQSVKWDDFYKVINEDFGTHWDTSQPVGVEPFFFWIRNIKGNSYSDWVKVKVTKNNIVTSGNELTGSGTVTKGYEQIDGSSGETKTDSSYGKTYHVDPDTKSVSSIIDYIKNGFGLLGDDGLIALFKETFSFLPAPVWTCIISMIAATCIIVIWKVVH